MSRGREMAQAGVAEAKIRTKRLKIYSSRPFCGVILDLKFSNLANKSKDMYRPTVAGSHLTLCQICNLMLLCLLCLFCLLCCDCGIIGGGCHDVLLVGVACFAGVFALLCCAFAVAFFFSNILCQISNISLYKSNILCSTYMFLKWTYMLLK